MREGKGRSSFGKELCIGYTEVYEEQERDSPNVLSTRASSSLS